MPEITGPQVTPQVTDLLAADLLLQPALRLRDGRLVRSMADAVALVREHESRPGIDTRDEVLHRLERASTDSERQAAAEAFFAWAKELDLLAPTAKTAERPGHK